MFAEQIRTGADTTPVPGLPPVPGIRRRMSRAPQPSGTQKLAEILSEKGCGIAQKIQSYLESEMFDGHVPFSEMTLLGFCRMFPTKDSFQRDTINSYCVALMDEILRTHGLSWE